MANTTWNLTDKDLRDNWSWYIDHQNNAPDYNKQENKLIQKILKIVNNTIINNTEQIDVDEVVRKVIAKTRDHEIRQTTNIIKNKKDISGIKDINIWKYN